MDFIKCFQHKAYPLSLTADHKKSKAHGGIFQTPIELTIHDYLHGIGQILPNVMPMIDIPLSGEQQMNMALKRRAVRVFSQTASITMDLLEGENTSLPPLTDEEKRKLKVFISFTFHEMPARVEEIITPEMLDDEMNIRKVLTSYHEKLTDYLSNTYRSQTSEIHKRFYRDIYYLLSSNGFLPHPTQRLGTSYSLPLVGNKLREISSWAKKEILTEEGKLYKIYSSNRRSAAKEDKELIQ